ncbi:MAG: hypothetical protein K8S16_12520 [Bacteroidales bacterium]|nr:hypothetical protein [Bacteroidales bacterium]
MISKTFSFLLVLLIVIVAISCRKDNTSPIVFELYPKEPVIEAAVGEKTIFNIEINGNDNILKEFTITQQEHINGIQTIFDTLINSSTFNYDFVYDVPVFTDSTLISLIFKVKNDQSEDITLSRRIRVLGDNILLEESTGHVMFSALSGNYSAFNLDWLQPLSVNDNSDSLLHFADHSIDSVHFNTLSREWYSPAGLRFVQFEGFSYPEATQSMLQNAYTYGIKLSSVDELENDDILIIGREEEALAVIYIVQILDTDTTLNDKYLFNLKK